MKQLSLVLLLITTVFCSSALAGVSGDFITWSLSVQPPLPITLTQTPELITMTAQQSWVAYGAGVGDPGSNDYNMAALITWTNSTTLGFAARADVNNLNLYELSYNPGDGYLAMVKISGGSSFSNLATANVGAIEFNKPYGMSFSVQGSTLVGEMWDGNTRLARIEATDSSYTTGVAGVFALKGGNDLLTGQWAVVPVPEPSTIGLLIAGSLVALLWRRYKK